MAEKIDGFTFKRVRSKRTSKYPWEQWLDGDQWKLRAEDLGCELTSEDDVRKMRQRMSALANNQGHSLKTGFGQDDNGYFIVIQSNGPLPEEADEDSEVQEAATV